MLKEKNNRRTFFKQGAVLTLAGLGAAKLIAQDLPMKTMHLKRGNYKTSAVNGVFKQDPLPYKYSDLEPGIDAQTMEIHYSKHHAGYVRKLNKAIAAYKGEKVNNLELAFQSMSQFPNAIRNNAGGHYNHTLFWKNMTPGGSKIFGRIKADIEAQFGSFENFKAEFSQAAATRFGSGWAWLVVTSDKKLQIGSSPNQDNPLMDLSDLQGTPILCLDVWEHAYYLKYKNKRKEYIENWWNLVNWETVEKLYTELDLPESDYRDLDRD